MEASAARKDQPAVEMSTAARLAEASRQIGGLEALARSWPLWRGFARGPLSALAALGELQAKGMWLDLARLLALGPDPEVSRPDLSLRWGVGFVSALRELESWETAKPLTPSLVGKIHATIDAPHLSRGIRSLGDGVIDEPIGGTAVWTLAPRWQKAKRPPVWALGLASVSWEKEGPDTDRRSVAGHALLWGLAPRLGINAPAFAYLAPCLERASSAQPGGLEGVLKSLRKDGAWRVYMEVFLAAVTASARATLELGLGVQQMHLDNSDLVNTWVRAPAPSPGSSGASRPAAGAGPPPDIRAPGCHPANRRPFGGQAGGAEPAFRGHRPEKRAQVRVRPAFAAHAARLGPG